MPRTGSLRRWLDHAPTRYEAYNTMPAVRLDLDARPTTETRRQADALFDASIRPASCFKNSKVPQKQDFFALLLHAAKIAHYHRGVIRYSRKLDKIMRQIIDAATEAGLFEGYRSPKGAPKQSRLWPLPRLVRPANPDPWSFAPLATTRYVVLRDRATEADIPFDPEHPTAKEVQAKLERVNLVNSLCRIEHEIWNEWEEIFHGVRQLRPVHFGYFIDSFERRGRIYTRKHGHQSLDRRERGTITFDGAPTVELDYGGLHPRMLYHLEGIDYRDDPYALWVDTTPPLRLMAKEAVNALINADSTRAAVSACNHKMMMRTEDGSWKRGKAWSTAMLLRRAVHTSGTTFKEVVRLGIAHHSAIAHRFGCDMGIANPLRSPIY